MEYEPLDEVDDPCPTRRRPADTGAAGALIHDPRVSMWLADPLSTESARALMRLQALAGLRRMAVMPDVHPSKSVCVGCVLGTEELIYPEAIGGDIGCGMSAVRMKGITAEDLTEGPARQVVRAMDASVDIMARSARSVETDIEPPSTDRLRDARLAKAAERFGSTQLGTLGRGNHFVEVQSDESGAVWIMVHSGSRAMGQVVASHYSRAAGSSGVKSVLPGLRLDSDAGQDYLADQEWCVRYAAANRRMLLHAAARTVSRSVAGRAEWTTLLDVPHNFLRIEEHDGVTLAVHRKGAAPASAGEVGVIPGSAGTLSVHTEGRGEPSSLRSSSHGAGRVMSRGDAKSAISVARLRRELEGVVYDTRRESSLRDEAPSAYRDLRIVMRAQRDLVRIVRTLRPLVSFKAGG